MYALRGGAGVDSVFQLGVAHAHIVSNKLLPPALLVGVSNGALHAAAIAEILQAPAQLDPVEMAKPESRRAASLNRFREILYAYRDFLIDVPGTLPDAFEADAGRPLKPNPQAIHFQTERDSRQQALRARSGLIALFNDLFRQQVTIRTLTRALRAYLGFKAAAEFPGWLKTWVRIREGWHLVKALGSAPLQSAQLVTSFVHAWFGGTARVLRTAVQGWPPSWLRELLDARLRGLEGRHGEGYTAGQIIFSSKRARLAPHILLFLGLVLAVLGGAAWATVFFARAAPEFFLLCVLPALAVLVACTWADRWGEPSTLLAAWRSADWKERILAYYDLRQDLGNDYVVEDLLIRLFNPTYHGEVDLADVADRAMQARDKEHAPTPNHQPRLFSSFTNAKHAPTRVVPFVADLVTGTMTAVEEARPIVDGLRAAVASVPLLRPVPNDDETNFYVDGSNVSADATSPAIDVLRLHLHPNVAKVRIFSVVPVTLREEHQPAPATATVNVALAGAEISRFRDHHVDREIADLYNTLLPEKSRRPERLPEKTERALACFGNDSERKPLHFVRSEIVAIEPTTALHATGRFLEARTKLARHAVIASAVAEGCRATLTARLQLDKYGCRAAVGGDPDIAPGAIEVCEHCTAFRPAVKPAVPPPEPASHDPAITEPEPPSQLPKTVKPTVNLLFSGGVFRGVFQIGVLNGLKELGVKPNVIAGSSVGSIVAAMIARVFTSTEPDCDMARLASTFMTLDRLIITDRFADFVRRFTLRSAAARFSLHDADVFFRNYDVEVAEFGSVARRVVGGIEHLFYVSPYNLSLLVQAFRGRRYTRVRDLLTRYAQEICDRSLVGTELLGAEPLALLIKQHVLSATDRNRHSHALSLNAVGGAGLTFLLTATNLMTREREIFSSEATGEDRAALIEVLLASSAFPGVFRPRWSREVLIHDNTEHQYIDGGVLDNLPVSAVVDHMYGAAGRYDIAFRPENNQPHLVLTASLEPEAPAITDPAEAAGLGRAWTAAANRAKRLRYNQKIDRFAKAQRDLRFIWRQYASVAQKRPIGLETLDIEVVVVKPKWLCDTFAFHPMLGFRRSKQAASIAHGCAATFSTFAQILAGRTPSNPEWVDGWTATGGTHDLLLEEAGNLTPRTMKDGTCHFRKTAQCPFAYQTLKAKIPEDVMRDGVKHEVDAIYRACGERVTHTPDYV